MLRLAAQIFLKISVVNQDVHPCKMSATDFPQDCYFCLKTQSKIAQNSFYLLLNLNELLPANTFKFNNSVPLIFQFDPLTIFMQNFTNFGSVVFPIDGNSIIFSIRLPF